MGVIVFVIIGIIICGICATRSEQAAQQWAIDEAKLKEIRRTEREARERAQMTEKVKREAIKRVRKVKFEAMVQKEMKKILEKS